MYDVTSIRREGDVFITSSGDIIDEQFPTELWDCPEAYNMAGIVGYEPMTAKELETEEEQDEKLDSTTNYVEEKFDGTRALVYFLSQENAQGKDEGFCRVFSRRVSKKTGFYVENSDSLPQIRDIDVPELDGTILDGEMFINGLPFKEVSSTLNCLWSKAIDRQIEKGFISLHAFDILFYKGIDLRKMSLAKRKKYLHLAVEEANSDYIEEVPYYTCGAFITDLAGHTVPTREIMTFRSIRYKNTFSDDIVTYKDTYPHFYNDLINGYLTPRGYYELIVASGGEGLIVKPIEGKYLHKRGWEYSKVKKFLTRELVVLDFDEPTKVYDGKDRKNWQYWADEVGNRLPVGVHNDPHYVPVTKFYYYNLVGNLRLGLLITHEEYEAIPKNKRGAIYYPSIVGFDSSYDDTHHFMLVCECSGFDDATREYFTEHEDEICGSVVEVKANEIFKDSGKLRHPRFLRVRNDKEPERCTWKDHVGA